MTTQNNEKKYNQISGKINNQYLQASFKIKKYSDLVNEWTMIRDKAVKEQEIYKQISANKQITKYNRLLEKWKQRYNQMKN